MSSATPVKLWQALGLLESRGWRGNLNPLIVLGTCKVINILLSVESRLAGASHWPFEGFSNVRICLLYTDSFWTSRLTPFLKQSLPKFPPTHRSSQTLYPSSPKLREIPEHGRPWNQERKSKERKMTEITLILGSFVESQPCQIFLFNSELRDSKIQFMTAPLVRVKK